MELGVALSGGGIKSFGQIPILNAIYQEGHTIDNISGTSMGAVIAALVASGLLFDEISEIALSVEEELIKTKLFMKPSAKVLPFSKEKISGGYVDGQVLEDILAKILADHGIEHISDVKIPLAIPAVDFLTGKVVVFVSHPHLFKAQDNWDIISDISLAKAVRASCSFPFVLSMYIHENYKLIDGGVKMNIPSLLNKAYKSKKIIAVTMTNSGEYKDADSMMSQANRIYDLMIESFNEAMMNHIDLMINIPVGDVWVFELGKGKDVLFQGEIVALKSRKDIRNLKKKTPLINKIIR